jgi:SHS2 domain-containing protein
VPYDFLDDAPTADVGVRAWGATLEECFLAAAAATLEVMVANPDAVETRVHRAVRLEAERLDMVLLRLLEELIYYKDSEGLLLRATQLAVAQHDGRWRVEASLQGERLDPARHELAGDVKAVTLHMLRVWETPTGWEATVVLDV